MGLIVDSDVFIFTERSRAALDLSAYSAYEEFYISAITVTELMAGVHHATELSTVNRRVAFIEKVSTGFPCLAVDADVARTHALMVAAVPKNQTVGAHDALIAATALHHGHAVLTRNGKDFRKFVGLEVLDYTPLAQQLAK